MQMCFSISWFLSTGKAEYRYLIQRKQNGTDGNTFTYEAGANAVDELGSKGGIDAYIEQVCIRTSAWTICK